MEKFNAEEVTKKVAEEIDKLATLSNKEYFDKMDQARRSIANQQAAKWMQENPYKPEEYPSIDDYYKKAIQVGKEALDKMPTYMETELRTLVQWNSSMFTLGANILNELVDFKNLFIAVNEAKLNVYASKHAKDIQKTQEETKEGDE